MTEPQFWSDVKGIFIKWEKLRVPYNLILLITLVVSLATVSQSMRGHFINPSIIIAWLFAAIGANICYFAAPIVEAYACWLGVKGRWITTILFVLGVLISIPLVAVFGLGPAGMLLPPQL